MQGDHKGVAGSHAVRYSTSWKRATMFIQFFSHYLCPECQDALLWAVRFGGFAYRQNTKDKYLILIKLTGYIDRIYAEFVHIYLRVRRRQNGCTFSGGLAVASGLRSASLIGPKKYEMFVGSRTARAMNVSCRTLGHIAQFDLKTIQMHKYI